MNTILSKWKKNQSILKLLLIWFIFIILILEFMRRFIHNLTTKVGFWMFLTGMLTSVILMIWYLYTKHPELIDPYFEWIRKLI